MACVFMVIESVLSEPFGRSITTHRRSETGFLFYEGLRGAFDIHLFTEQGDIDLAKRWLASHAIVGWSGLHGPEPYEGELFDAKVKVVSQLRQARLYAVIDSPKDALELASVCQTTAIGVTLGPPPRLPVTTERMSWSAQNDGVVGWTEQVADETELIDLDGEEQ